MGISAAPALRDGKDGALKGTLTFYSYGTAYLLKKVWMEGDISGALLPASIDEREMAKTARAKGVVEISRR